jgi:hypothetical protein
MEILREKNQTEILLIKEKTQWKATPADKNKW